MSADQTPSSSFMSLDEPPPLSTTSIFGTGWFWVAVALGLLFVPSGSSLFICLVSTSLFRSMYYSSETVERSNKSRSTFFGQIFMELFASPVSKMSRILSIPDSYLSLSLSVDLNVAHTLSLSLDAFRRKVPITAQIKSLCSCLCEWLLPPVWIIYWNKTDM